MNSLRLRFAASVAALVLLLALAPRAAQALTPSEKAGRLAALREEFAAETGTNGIDSERAVELQASIAELERTPTTEPALSLDDAPGGAGGTDEPAPPPEPPPSEPEFHQIRELTPPDTYVRRDGVKNPCGPYAVSAILQSFGQSNDFSEIYDAVTPAGGTIGAGPHELITYLHGSGHSAVERNHGSLDDIAAGIDRGERMLMMMNTREPPSIKGSHWVTVKGYRVVNGKRYWTLVDAAWGEGGEFGPGGDYDPLGMPEEEFARRWGSPIGGVLGAGSGFHNYYITVGKDPPGLLERARTALYGLNDTTPSAVLDSGLRDVTRGFENTFGANRTVGQRIGGFFDMVGGGVSKILLNIPSLLISAGGHLLRDAGSALRGWAADKWANGGFFGKVAAVGATVLGAICTGAGWVLNGIGTIGSAILGVAGDVIGAVGGAIGDAVDWVGSLF